MRRSLAVATTALIAVAIAGCGSSGRGVSCDEQRRKEEVLELASSYYLYQDLLPQENSLADYATAADLLDALTAEARAQNLDRGWSFVMPASDASMHYDEGKAVGYGIGFRPSGAAPALQVFVTQAIEGAPAALAHFARGDEILAAGPDGSSLQEVAGMDESQIAALLSSGGVAGTPKALRVIPAGKSTAELRTMTSGVYAIHPVPSYQVFEGTHVGYVQLRTFIPQAESDPQDNDLRDAFAYFKDHTVDDVVVDLRYNGGGTVSTAEVLANLLGQGLAPAKEKMFDLVLNEKHQDSNEHVSFGEEANGGTFPHVAFITTGDTASASELVPNVLDAYFDKGVQIAYVGSKTYGKPVGQLSWTLTGCNTAVFLISFSLANAEGHGAYYDGLPDELSHGPLCDAEDDLTHPQDSIDEASTHAAAYFAEHGSCPPSLRAPGAAPSGGRRQLRDPARGLAQEMAGTF